MSILAESHTALLRDLDFEREAARKLAGQVTQLECDLAIARDENAKLTRVIAAIANHAPDEWARDIAYRTLEGLIDEWLAIVERQPARMPATQSEGTSRE